MGDQRKDQSTGDDIRQCDNCSGATSQLQKL
jgi:hypothetical protein